MPRSAKGSPNCMAALSIPLRSANGEPSGSLNCISAGAACMFLRSANGEPSGSSNCMSVGAPGSPNGALGLPNGVPCRLNGSPGTPGGIDLSIPDGVSSRRSSSIRCAPKANDGWASHGFCMGAPTFSAGLGDGSGCGADSFVSGVCASQGLTDGCETAGWELAFAASQGFRSGGFEGDACAGDGGPGGADHG